MVEENTIINGNCVDFWREIKELNISLILTDLPYNIGFDYNSY